MGVGCEQEGVEHMVLVRSGVPHRSGGGVAANPNCLGSVCKEVQYPVAECGTQAQSAQFVNQFHGGDYIER